MNAVSFANLPTSTGPIFVGSYAPGKNVEPWEPATGSMVSAHAGTVTVPARIIAAGDCKYKAEVIGFENWNGYTYKELTPTVQIDLIYEQLFGCSR